MRVALSWAACWALGGGALAARQEAAPERYIEVVLAVDGMV